MDKRAIFEAVTAAAALSTAKRRKVGAIIVDDLHKVIVTRGYNHNNGKPCEDEHGNTLDSVVHAEVCAVDNLGQRGLNLSQCTLYVSHQPCVDCEAYLKSQGLKYEVVSEFLKFDGDKLRYDLVPTSTTKMLCFNEEPYNSDTLYHAFNFFEKYRELYPEAKEEALDMLEEAFVLLSMYVEGGCKTIPTKALHGIATILTFGARKYKPNNWRNCTELERYDAAFMRHYLAYVGGEELDADSGYSHLWHALTNLSFLVELR